MMRLYVAMLSASTIMQVPGDDRKAMQMKRKFKSWWNKKMEKNFSKKQLLL
jgi:hypothetical protein